MTRSVADCAPLDRVGHRQRRHRAAQPEGSAARRAARALLEPLDPRAGAPDGSVLARLKDAGAVLVEGDIADVGRLDDAAGFPDRALRDRRRPERLPREARLAAEARRAGRPSARAPTSPAAAGLHGETAVPEPAYRHALDVLRPPLQAAYRDHFAGMRLDAIVFPTTPSARRADRRRRDGGAERRARADLLTFIRNTSPGSVAGIPGISLPAALTADGLPLGLETRRAAGSDRRLLAIAPAVEALLPRMPAPPGSSAGAANPPSPLETSQSQHRQPSRTTSVEPRASRSSSRTRTRRSR